jgi:hypothetical protein
VLQTVWQMATLPFTRHFWALFFCVDRDDGLDPWEGDDCMSDD